MVGNAIRCWSFEEQCVFNLLVFGEWQALRLCFKLVEEFSGLLAFCPFALSDENLLFVKGFSYHIQLYVLLFLINDDRSPPTRCFAPSGAKQLVTTDGVSAKAFPMCCHKVGEGVDDGFGHNVLSVQVD